jgi:hypothetical protein
MSDKMIARIVGVIFIVGMVVGVAANILMLSILNAPDHFTAVAASSFLLAFGVLLWLIAVVGDAAHGILMFPILKRYNEMLAIGYLGARIIDSLLIGLMALLVLFQIPIAVEYVKAGADTSYLQALSAVFMQGHLYAYHFGMISLGFAGLMLCYAFYKAKLVPNSIAIWGLVGYATILIGSLVEVMGFNLSSIHTIPGGLWEMFIGFWLIIKGFNTGNR